MKVEPPAGENVRRRQPEVAKGNGKSFPSSSSLALLLLGSGGGWRSGGLFPSRRTESFFVYEAKSEKKFPLALPGLACASVDGGASR
jgi:hypothetical protein